MAAVVGEESSVKPDDDAELRCRGFPAAPGTARNRARGSSVGRWTAPFPASWLRKLVRQRYIARGCAAPEGWHSHVPRVKAIQVQPADPLGRTSTRQARGSSSSTTIQRPWSCVRSVLEANEYGCLTASSGEEALDPHSRDTGNSRRHQRHQHAGHGRHRAAQKPELAARSRIRRRESFFSPPILESTSLSRLCVSARWISLTKPVGPQSLLRAVRTAVERVKHEREMAQLQNRVALAEQAEEPRHGLEGLGATAASRRRCRACPDARVAPLPQT